MSEMKLEVLPLYLFPSIDWFHALLSFQSSQIQIEVCENWLKQSPRSRYDVCGSNGRLQLVIPTVRNTRKTLKDVEISYDENWPVLHRRSLDACYNRSPFYEYYKDDLYDIFDTRPKKLMDLSLSSLQWCCKKLQLEVDFELTTSFKSSQEIEKSTQTIEKYTQVFDEKKGFESGLSVLDLLFNLGPEATTFLHQTLRKSPYY